MYRPIFLFDATVEKWGNKHDIHIYYRLSPVTAVTTSLVARFPSQRLSLLEPPASPFLMFTLNAACSIIHPRNRVPVVWANIGTSTKLLMSINK